MTKRLLFPGLLALIASLLLVSQQVKTYSADAVTQPEHRFGLAKPELRDDVYFATPRFSLDGRPVGASSAGAKVFLWDFVKQVNAGENLPSLRQEDNDCTAFGATNGMHYLQCRSIAQGERVEFQELHPSFTYGVSRTAPDIGAKRLGRSGGAVGQWSVAAPAIYGALPKSAPGVPPYKGSLSAQWGISGPPKEFYKYAEPHKLGSYARCDDYEAIRDAIASGYPVTIASNQGFRMQQQKYDGRMFGTASGTWPHQMCFIGVDDTAKCPDGSTGALYILNSWGPSAHSEPINDEPRGGFWVSKKIADRMAKSGEAYALSEFSGFPYKPLNIRVFSSFPQQLIAVSTPAPGVKYLTEYVGLDRSQTRYAAVGVLAFAGLALIPRRRSLKSKGFSRTTTA